MLKKGKNKIVNVDNIFTDLFGSLIKYKTDENRNLHLDYSSREISRMLLGVDNAITMILQGLQGLGKMLSMCSLSEAQDMMHVGHFLAILGNLLEALNSLRADFEFELMSGKTLQQVGNESENVMSQVSN